MKATVLIVDDSSLARRSTRQLLEALDCTVVEASDGAEAIERYYLAPPDLVMLDMVMRGMYGLDVLSKLREINPEVRVIVSTADIQTSTAEQVKAAGAKAILNKPLNRDKLSAAVDIVLAGGDTWN